MNYENMTNDELLNEAESSEDELVKELADRLESAIGEVAGFRHSLFEMSQAE